MAHSIVSAETLTECAAVTEGFGVRVEKRGPASACVKGKRVPVIERGEGYPSIVVSTH